MAPKIGNVAFMRENFFSPMFSVLVSAAVTECRRWGGLNNSILLLTVLDAGKSEISVSSWLGSGEDPVSGLQMSIFSCPYMVRQEIISPCHY